MDTIHTNSTNEVPKISTEKPQSQQPINSTPALVWNVMAKTNDCSDDLQNTGHTTHTIKLPEEPVKCSPPEQNDEHFNEIPSAPCETTLSTCEVPHSNTNTFQSSQNDFPQASSSMETPIQWTSQQIYTSAGPSSQQTYTSADPSSQQTYTSADPSSQQTYTSAGPSSQQIYTSAGPSSQQIYTSAGPSSQQTYTSDGPSSQQTYTSAGPYSHQLYMSDGPSSQQHYMSAHPSSHQLYMGALSSSHQHYRPSLATSQQRYMAPFPPWHLQNAHRYSVPQPMAGWEMMPPPGPSQPHRHASSGLQTKGTTAQPVKRPGININIRVGKCAHDAGTTEKFSTCGICCCLLIPIIGCIFCMKSKDVVCAKCEKVIGKASREKKIEQGKCAHDGGTQEKFSKCGVCCCLLLPIIGCIFCSRNKNLVCVKCDKVVGKVSKEKVKNIEECEKSKVVARKQRKAKKRKQKHPPNKEKKKLIRKVSQKKTTNLEGEVRRRSKMNVENPR